jgi:hypothetical protein
MTSVLFIGYLAEPAVSSRQRGSEVDLALDRAPFGEKDAVRNLQAILQAIDADDAVEPEMTEIVAQFAPGSENLGAVEEADRDRPDYPLGRGAFSVAVGQAQLSLRSDGASNQARVRASPPEGATARPFKRVRGSRSSGSTAANFPKAARAAAASTS